MTSDEVGCARPHRGRIDVSQLRLLLLAAVAAAALSACVSPEPATSTFIEGKARVSQLGQHSSLYERNRYLAEGTTFEAATELSHPDYAPYGGSVPLLSTTGACDGLVIVSGLSQEGDHNLAVAGITSVQQP